MIDAAAAELGRPAGAGLSGLDTKEPNDEDRKAWFSSSYDATYSGMDGKHDRTNTDGPSWDVFAALHREAAKAQAVPLNNLHSGLSAIRRTTSTTRPMTS